MSKNLLLPPAYNLPPDQSGGALGVLYALKLMQMPEVLFSYSRDMDDLLDMAGDYLVWSMKDIAFLRKLEDDSDAPDYSELSDREFMEAVAFNLEGRRDFNLEYVLNNYRKLRVSHFFKLMRRTQTRLEQWLEPCLDEHESRVRVLADFLRLDSDERTILGYLHLQATQRYFRNFINRLKCTGRNPALNALAAALGMDSQRLARLIGPKSRLRRFDLIECCSRPDDIAELLAPSHMLEECFSWEYASSTELARHLIQEMPPSNHLDIGDFDHLGRDKEIILHLVRQALERGERGVNILLYGGTGTGKTEFAKCLAGALGLEAFRVAAHDAEGDSPSKSERLQSLRLCHQYLEGRRDTLLVLDEAEDIFGFGGEMFGFLSMFISKGMGSNTSKAWLNETLEQGAVPTIWISNTVDQIDHAILRRFQYQLRFPTPPLEKRRSILKRQFEGAPVSGECIEVLARDAQLPPAAMHAAARLASLAGSGSDIPCDAIVQQYVENFRQVMELKQPEPQMEGQAPFDLHYCNTRGSAPLPKVVEAVTRTGRGSLLLHGVSGTGKTSLARDIAERIGKPLLRKAASDLLDKYVGETEKALGRMFEEAREQDAVLLLDEADSFMRSREMARHGWEASQVNELLQRMESFDGIFICATNLMNDIDAAAMRRFVFKIEFLPLTRVQREELFVLHALTGCNARFTKAHRRALAEMDQLTPGDFAVVSRQAAILREQYAPEEFLQRLQDELLAKPQSGLGRLGFQTHENKERRTL